MIATPKPTKGNDERLSSKYIEETNTNRTDIQKVYWVADKIYEYEYNGVTFEVDIVNPASYTDNGYGYTMFGPFPTMVGDTVMVISYYNDWENDYSDTIKIILE